MSYISVAKNLKKFPFPTSYLKFTEAQAYLPQNPNLVDHNLLFQKYGWVRPKPLTTPVNALSPSFNQRAIRLEKIDLTQIDLGSNKQAFILHNVFTKTECENLIDLTESIGYEQALVQVSGGGEMLNTTLRNNSRIIIFDEPFADTILERVYAKLPNFFLGGALSGLNERIKFLRYFEGQRFKPHYDGIYTRPDGSQRSLLTLQMYLNDDFEGGETVFHNPETRKTMAVVPKMGTVLGFQKDLLHEGAILTSGTKYTIRTGVMYTPNYIPVRIDLE